MKEYMFYYVYHGVMNYEQWFQEYIMNCILYELFIKCLLLNLASETLWTLSIGWTNRSRPKFMRQDDPDVWSNAIDRYRIKYILAFGASVWTFKSTVCLILGCYRGILVKGTWKHCWEKGRKIMIIKFIKFMCVSLLFYFSSTHTVFHDLA